MEKELTFLENIKPISNSAHDFDLERLDNAVDQSCRILVNAVTTKNTILLEDFRKTTARACILITGMLGKHHDPATNQRANELMLLSRLARQFLFYGLLN